jgi:sorbitol/mannitol transport system permease protein
MARAVPVRRRIVFTALAWAIAFLIFFPILWTVLTSFKTEGEAVTIPPNFVFFDWTLENYAIVQERSNYLKFASNSVFLALGSTLLGLLIAIPAAWAMAFAPGRRTKDLLMWMLSTKMMPPVGALIPLYLIFRDLKLLDTHIGIIIVLTLLNLPIIIWMLYTYFKEIPSEILEASRMDGASVGKELIYVLAPMALPGIASTLLLNVILAWNLEPHDQGRRAAHPVHRLLFKPGGPVLGQALGGFHHGHRPHPGPRLVCPEATRPRPYIRSSEVAWARSP